MKRYEKAEMDVVVLSKETSIKTAECPGFKCQNPFGCERVEDCYTSYEDVGESGIGCYEYYKGCDEVITGCCGVSNPYYCYIYCD